MARVSFFLALLLVSSLFAGDAKYGIKIDSFCYETKNQTQECNTTVTQNSKIVFKNSVYDMYEVYRGDLDDDGYDELVYKSFDGGGHCCFKLYIFQLKPDMPKPYILLLGNTEFVSFRDLDGDKKTEIITWDDEYSYLMGVCFACSPFVKVILNFNGKKLILRPDLMKKYKKQNNKLIQSVVKLNKYGYLDMDSDASSPVISEVLYDIYVGKVKNAIFIIKKYLKFENSAVYKLFLMDLVDALGDSPYWSQIRELNHWYEIIPSNFTKDGKDGKELFDKQEVIMKLFMLK